MLSPKKILDDINNKIQNRDIFKHNREFLIQSLIVASIQTQSVVFMSTFDLKLVDQILEQFRSILKFIFSTDNINLDIPESGDETIDGFCGMLFEFLEQYSPVRNYLEQCIIGNREIKYNAENNTYFEDKYDDFSNYARVLDKAKEFSSDDIKNATMARMQKYLNDNRYKPNLFKDRYFNSFIDDYVKICWLDSEIKFEHNFVDFNYGELISFCAALKLIADYYYITSFKQPYFSIEESILVNGITKFSGLPREKVLFFLKYQTYDCEYQKDKLTLIQSLIKCNGKYYFLPLTINVGLLPVKMYRVITDYDKEKYKNDISVIAHRKETQMTDEIVEKLKKYNLDIKLNHIIKNNNVPVAEYDMLVFDNITNNLYICEFKWYFVGDGEKEHKKINERIREAVAHRKEKDKYILDNPQKVCDELFEGKRVNTVHEILISQNFGGSTEHDMSVIDYETLQWSIERHDSFEELMNYFFSSQYRESIQLTSVKMPIEIEGYKFDFYRIAVKTN